MFLSAGLQLLRLILIWKGFIAGLAAGVSLHIISEICLRMFCYSCWLCDEDVNTRRQWSRLCRRSQCCIFRIKLHPCGWRPQGSQCRARTRPSGATLEHFSPLRVAAGSVSFLWSVTHVPPMSPFHTDVSLYCWFYLTLVCSSSERQLFIPPDDSQRDWTVAACNLPHIHFNLIREAPSSANSRSSILCCCRPRG